MAFVLIDLSLSIQKESTRECETAPPDPGRMEGSGLGMGRAVMVIREWAHFGP